MKQILENARSGDIELLDIPFSLEEIRGVSRPIFAILEAVRGRCEIELGGASGARHEGSKA